MTAETASSSAHTLPTLIGHRSFRAMNTTIDLFVGDPEDTAYFVPAEDVFHAMEARLSRFLPGSELTRFNDRAGRPTVVSPVLFDILLQAQHFHRLTDGAFEPAMLSELEAAGYDRSFELVDPTSGAPLDARKAEPFSVAQLRFEKETSAVRAPAGLRIDLGGIGKGYTVDAAAGVMTPARDFVVNAGGDIFASGSGPDGDGWLVSITDPIGDAAPVSLVRLRGEALATSTTARRRWERGGQVLHHLLDPRTRCPSQSGVMSASVVAPTATMADVFAKAALLLGPDEGTELLEEHGVEGLYVMNDRSLIYTPGWTGTRAE